MSDTKVIHSSDTSGHIFSLFLKYVSANVLGMIGFSCYILADTFFYCKRHWLRCTCRPEPGSACIQSAQRNRSHDRNGRRFTLFPLLHAPGRRNAPHSLYTVRPAGSHRSYFFRTDRTSWGRAFMPSPGSRQPDTPFCRPPISVSCWHLPPYFWPITFSYALSEMTVNPLYPWQE